MKIAYVNAPFLADFSRGQRSPAVTKGGTFYYPYWLAYAAGWAGINGHTPVLFDFVADGDSAPRAVARIADESPGLVVIDVATGSSSNDLAFADLVRRRLGRHVGIMLVGTHVSALPEDALKACPGADAAAVGEYDQTVVEAAGVLEGKHALSSVPGLAVRSPSGKPMRTAPRRPLSSADLDRMPFVSSVYARFLSIGRYYFAAARHPEVMIVTGRGCPFACNFCVFWQTLHGRVFRKRSPANVAAEFAYITRELPHVREVVIEDDTFTADIPRVREICRLLIAAGNRLPWSANVRVGIDRETLMLMKRAGCRLIITGFESGTQSILDAMGKHATVAMAETLMQHARSAGLLVHGCFMVGNPGETRATMEETLRHAIRLNPDSAQFYPLFVYPGTVSWNQYETNGWIRHHDFSRWLSPDGNHNTVIDLPGLTGREMVEFCERAYPRYYLRPSYIAMKLRQLVTDPAEGIRSVSSAGKYVAGRLAGIRSSRGRE